MPLNTEAEQSCVPTTHDVVPSNEANGLSVFFFHGCRFIRFAARLRCCAVSDL